MTIFTRAEHVLQELALIRLLHDRVISSGAIEMAHGGIASIPGAQPIRPSSYDTAPPVGQSWSPELRAQITKPSAVK
jgi:hypothetical protein